MANDIPRLSGLTGRLTFAENTANGTPQRLDADVSFSDADFFDSTLRVTGLLAEDRIAIAADSVIGIEGDNVLYNGAIVGQVSGGQGGDLIVFFNTSATAPAVEALIEHLTYRNVSERPAATRTLSLSIVDGAGDVAQPGFSATSDASSPFTGIDVGSYSKATLADLNGDGRLDLVVGAQDGTLRTYYRNADGSVTEQTGAANPFDGIDVGSFSAPAMADLNGDGRLDLVLGAQDGTLRTYYRNADGSVTEQTGAANPFNGIDVGTQSAPALADLNGDGRLDLVVGAPDGTLRTYYRNADGSVTAQTGAANPFNPFGGIDVGANSAPVLADLNGDGRLDLVVGAQDGTLRTYIRNTNGSVTEQTGAANPFDGVDVGSESTPALVDLDGDGRLDLVAGAEDGTLRSYTGGTGLSIAVAVTAEDDQSTLSGLSGNLTVAENAAPQRLDTDVRFADLDFNGGTLSVSGLLAEDRVGLATDSVITRSGSGVLYNGTVVGSVSGGQGTPFVVQFNAGATTAAVEAVIEHLTYQNLSDTPTATRTLTIDVTDTAGNHVQPVFETTPDANGPFVGVPVPPDSAAALGDLNGDGRLDLLVGARDGTLRTILRNADGSATEQTGAANPFDGIDVGSYSRPALGDLNGDGRLDLVAGTLEGTLHTYVRNADGSVSEQTGFANPFNGIDVGSYSSPALADLNGDGRLDLVVGAFDGTLRFYRHNNTSTFTELTGTANPFDGIDVGSYSSPVLGDLNGDGRLDLVVGTRDGTLRTWYRKADGSFSEQTGTANPFDGIDVGSNATPALGDLDGDGRLDLVVGASDNRLRSYTREISTVVTVTAENDAPTLTGVSGALTLRQDSAGATPQRLFASAVFRDPDSLPSAVTVSGLAAADRVALATDDGVGLSGSSVTYNGTLVGFLTGGDGETLVLSFNGAATAAAVTAILRHLTFETAAGATSSRDLQVTLTDAGSSVSPAPLTVTYDASTILTGLSLGGHDGTLRAGESVSLTMNFTGPVTVTGTPVLTLSDGGIATYVSGSGTNSLVFSHTVARGQNAADLTVTGLQGGTIRDGLGGDLGPVPAGGIDPAGTLRVDTLAPDAPTVTGPAAGDTVATPTPTITGTAEAGSRVLVSIDGEQTDTVLAGSDGRFSATVTDPLGFGAHSVVVFAIDEAGNASTARTSGFTVSNGTPAGLALAAGDDTGASASDGLTRKAAVTVSGNGLSGATVLLFDDTNANGTFDGGERLLGSAGVVGGRFSAAVTLAGDGLHHVVAVQSGPNGFGAGSAPLDITLDTAAPRAPTVALATDTGASAEDGITRDAGLAVTPSEPGGRLSYTIDGGPATASYDPTKLADGPHTVSVTQTDAAGNVSTVGSLTFTLDTLNPLLSTAAPAPVKATGPDGAPVSFGITATDVIDAAVRIVHTLANGTVVRSGDVFPVGDTVVTATAEDDAGNVVSGTFTVTVVSANQVPVASDGMLSADEDEPLTSILSASDPDNTVLTYMLGTGPAHGTLDLKADGRFTYTPDADFHGTDSFTFRPYDGALYGAYATVSLSVASVNDAPVAVDDTLSAVAEDSGPRTIAFSALTGNDSRGPSNEGGQSLTVASVANAVGGTVAIVGGAVVFTPDTDFNGTASFDYGVRDDGTSNGVADPRIDTGHASFAVTPVNDAPSALSLSGSTIAENAAAGAPIGLVSATDPDAGDSVTYRLLDTAGGRFSIGAASGEIRVAAGARLDYETAQAHQVVVEVSDAAGATYRQAFTIGITDVVETQTRTGTGTAAADVFLASSADNWIYNGLAGNDRITTLGGNDVVRGNAGDDVIDTGAGDDIVTFFQNREGFDRVDGGMGNDRIDALANGTVIGLSALSGIETISANGYTGVTIAGSAAGDVLDFSALDLIGIGRIDGGAGNDTITGSSGNDLIVGGAGNDILRGGVGGDVFEIGSGAGADTIVGGTGTDTIRILGSGATVTWGSVSEVEVVTGTNARIAGTAGNDVLDFSGITLTGIYKIYAGAGNDTIIGSSGNDVLAFSDGTDMLTGGAGRDIFDLDVITESGVGGLADTILDFVQNEDVISLTDVDASTKTGGNQAFSFLGTGAFTGKAGQLRYDNPTADTTAIYGDVNGDRVADFMIKLAEYSIMSSADFVL